jgi:hypothetical protein
MMALSFVVVCEARDEYLSATKLAHRVYCDSVDRIEPEILDVYWFILHASAAVIKAASITLLCQRAQTRAKSRAKIIDARDL